MYWFTAQEMEARETSSKFPLVDYEDSNSTVEDSKLWQNDNYFINCQVDFHL